MKVKVIKEFLGIPRGTVGEVIKETGPWSADIKFESKDEPVQVCYPMDNYYIQEGA